MIRDARRTPFKFNFGAPSCVPATTFETAGATLKAGAVAQLLAYIYRLKHHKQSSYEMT